MLVTYVQRQPPLFCWSNVIALAAASFFFNGVPANVSGVKFEFLTSLDGMMRVAIVIVIIAIVIKSKK